MERRKYFIMMLTIMVVFCCVGFTHAEGEKGEEVKMINKVVTVKTYEGLVPATLRSEPGTTVIWVNHSPQPVEILFLDKKVVLACGAPVNFLWVRMEHTNPGKYLSAAPPASVLRKKASTSMYSKHPRPSIL